MSHIERIQCGNGNCYLVTDGESAILVDTGRTKFREKILAKCRGKNVRLIVLTHGHVDHVQNAAFLSEALHAPVAMHGDDYGLAKDNRSEPMSAHGLLGKIVLKLSQKSFQVDKIEPFEPQVFLKDGDSLREYGVPAAVVELPGHTKGSIGILVDDTDILVGDALMNMFCPAKSLLYGDRGRMEQSAARISALGGVTVHFGHGKPVKNRDW